MSQPKGMMIAMFVVLQVIGAILLSAAVTAAPAGADPTPAPSPFQIIGPNGPVVQGVPTYPPICLVAPLACALRYTPCR